jgi:hypothetical protein
MNMNIGFVFMTSARAGFVDGAVAHSRRQWSIVPNSFFTLEQETSDQIG